MPLRCRSILRPTASSLTIKRPPRRLALSPCPESLEARQQPGTLLASPLDALVDPLRWFARPSTQPAADIEVTSSAVVALNRSWSTTSEPIALAEPALDSGHVSTLVFDIAPTTSGARSMAGAAGGHRPDAARRGEIGLDAKDEPDSASGDTTGDDKLNPGTPPTGGSEIPPTGIRISGPGEMPIRPGSVIFVSDNTTGGDASALWWDAPSGTPIITDVPNWDGVVTGVQNRLDGSVTDPIISGQGNPDGGTSTSTTATGNGGLDAGQLNPDEVAAIRPKLEPNARLIVLSCGQGMNAGLQDLANELGIPAIGNPSGVNSGTNGNGDRIQFDPKKSLRSPVVGGLAASIEMARVDAGGGIRG